MTARDKEIEQHATDISNTWLPQDYQQVAYDAAVKMAKWTDQHPREGLWDAEKVCEWLRNNSSKYMTEGINYPHYAYNSLVEGLQKAMED